MLWEDMGHSHYPSRELDERQISTRTEPTGSPPLETIDFLPPIISSFYICKCIVRANGLMSICLRYCRQAQTSAETICKQSISSDHWEFLVQFFLRVMSQTGASPKGGRGRIRRRGSRVYGKCRERASGDTRPRQPESAYSTDWGDNFIQRIV